MLRLVGSCWRRALHSFEQARYRGVPPASFRGGAPPDHDYRVLIIVSEATEGTTWPEIPERLVTAPVLRMQPLHESWAAPSVPPRAAL